MNHTTNYNLNQWEASDKVQRVDFNADNAKIDTAIAAVDARVDGLSGSKADVSALEAEVSARTAAISALNQALTQKGNCQIVTGSYTGTGKVGASNPNSLSFSKKPVLVVIGGFSTAVMVRGGDNGYMLQPGTSDVFVTTWSQNGVSWYCSFSDATPYHQMNESGKRYNYVAFLSV